MLGNILGAGGIKTDTNPDFKVFIVVVVTSGDR